MLNPRPILLSLLLGSESHGQGAMTARALLASCALFGLRGNAVRVALARAVAAGLLVTPRRGDYALGPQARPLADEVGRWRQLTAQLNTDWQPSHGWIAVHVGATGRSDRSALRARERAFGLLGLAEFERGLFVRPDNLAGGAQALRSRLHALLPDGTEPGTVFALRDVSASDLQRALSLWDGEALNTTYRATTADLAAWLDQADTLPLHQAAREAFVRGHAAIRQMVYDPLLPAPLVDADARARCLQTVARYDDAGNQIWRRFLAQIDAGAASANAHAGASTASTNISKNKILLETEA